MRILMIFIVLTQVLCTSSDNAGSAIFYKKLLDSRCWNQNEIVKLRARKIFEDIVPPKVEPNEINNDYLKEELRYFRRTLRYVEKNSNPHLRRLLREALSDTVGAHLRKEILPAARFAYYAGFVPIINVKQLHDFYNEQKDFLNTKGIGWKAPDATPHWSNITVAKIPIGSETIYDPCSYLVVKRDSNNCIHMALPKLDDDVKPSAIALPFKHGELLSLTSPKANNILMKYYTTASKCILAASPEHCRHDDFVNFNNEMWHWIRYNVAPHLLDETLYNAFGGVLRVAAAVQNYGSGLTRRNLFSDKIEAVKKMYPWHFFCDNSNSSDWTPKLYVAVVVMTAIAICLMQMCYSYACGETCCGDRCCVETTERGPTYVNETALVQTQPEKTRAQSATRQQFAYIYRNPEKNSSSKAKSISVGSMRTQKVYDFNENTEKLMDIISDNEPADEYSSSDESGQEDVEVETGKGRAVSPPKIDTPISQIKLVKMSQSKRNTLPMYSTSTMVKTETGDQRESDTVNAWSESESTCSTNTCSTSSKSCKSKSSRDLAWARRVLSKNSYKSLARTSTKTEIDINSYTTPPSRR